MCVHRVGSLRVPPLCSLLRVGLDDGLRLVLQEIERRVLEHDGHALPFRILYVAVLVALDFFLGEFRLARDEDLARVIRRDTK